MFHANYNLKELRLSFNKHTFPRKYIIYIDKNPYIFNSNCRHTAKHVAFTDL